MTSCENFDDINTNPDATTKVTPALLATGLILNITQTGGNKNFIYDDFLEKYMAWPEGMESYQYNIFERSSFGGYTTLINAVKMVEISSDNEKDAYEALAYFIKAYKLFYISMEMGDIPYKEALLGETGGIKPKYDTQKDVMMSVLNDLDKAYELFSNAKNFYGDPLHNGDTEKWKKITSAFQLKVLMYLSLKDQDGDLKIKERFAKVFSSNSLMTSNTDNLQLFYADKANTLYPFYYTETKHNIYPMLSTTLINPFKETKDPRLFYYAKPAESKLNEGYEANEWDAYIGVNPAWSFEIIKNDFSAGKFCGLNLRYTNLPSGEPLIRIGFAEQNFIIAEAIVRGWIDGDASDFYKKGIKASLDFITDNTPDEIAFNNGRPMTEEVKREFLNSDLIALSGSVEEKIEKIISQKYLASFLQRPYDSYYDYRRTGYPKLPINPETNQNSVKSQFPQRWMYPKSEYDYNSENVLEAVQRQYGGVDDVNKLMWILQK